MQRRDGRQAGRQGDQYNDQMVLVTVMCEQEENFGEIINVSRHTFVEAPAFKDSDTMHIDCILRFQYVPQTVTHKNKKKKSSSL